jgi:hypothetical protein
MMQMTGRRMDWRKARLWGKPTLDFRYEHDMPDRAQRWLNAVERNQLQRRPRHRERRVSFGSTAASSC